MTLNPMKPTFIPIKHLKSCEFVLRDTWHCLKLISLGLFMVMIWNIYILKHILPSLLIYPALITNFGYFPSWLNSIMKNARQVQTMYREKYKDNINAKSADKEYLVSADAVPYFVLYLLCCFAGNMVHHKLLAFSNCKDLSSSYTIFKIELLCHPSQWWRTCSFNVSS